VVFVVVNGVPSIGVQVMVGSGQIGDQERRAVAQLPSSSILPSAGSSGSQQGGTSRLAVLGNSFTLLTVLWIVMTFLS
jgi:hypothetical protein